MSDSDSDDEFLALATGRGSKKRQKKKQAKKKAAKKSKKRRDSDSDGGDETRSDSGDDSLTDESSLSDVEPVPRKRVSRGVRASAAASDNEDKEDDIADDPDLARLRKEVESYGKDLYIDDDDRRRLMKMNDLDRQQILAEREEKLNNYQERIEVRRKLREKQSGVSARRQARTGGNRLSELKEKRNAKKNKVYDGEDSESDREQKPKSKPVCTITLDQLRMITLRRADLAKWDMFPYFDDVVDGCFVRFLLPSNKPGDKPVYRVCRIEGVEQYKRVYKLDQQTGQMSNTGLMLSHGTAKKLFAMDNISNSPITPDEFDRWRKVLESEYQNFPNIDYIEKRVEKLNQQRNHANTKEEMSHMLQRKTALRTIPTNIAEARAKLSFERDRATATGNKEDIERIENEMARLDEVSKSRTKQSSAMEQFAEINRRNRDRDLLRGNRLADDERASKALSPAIPSPSKASGSERGISPAPGASPQLSIASGAPVGIGISLGEAQREGTPATDSQQQNGTPSLSIVVDKPKNPSTFDFDDDLPPPADELLI